MTDIGTSGSILVEQHVACTLFDERLFVYIALRHEICEEATNEVYVHDGVMDVLFR